MTKTDIITTLIESLTKIQNTPRAAADRSESGNRRTMNKVVEIAHAADLDKASRKQVIRAIHLEANPSGYYYTESGVKAGLEALKAVLSDLEGKNEADSWR